MRIEVGKNYRGPPKNWYDVRRLGRGGSAEVFLCKDKDNEYELARKSIWIQRVTLF